jgi:hypothetical protein
MAKILIRNIVLFATIFSFTYTAATTYASGSSFRVEIKTEPETILTSDYIRAHVYRSIAPETVLNDQYISVATAIRNISKTDQLLYIAQFPEDTWISDNPAVHVGEIPVMENLVMGKHLKPGEVYKKELLVRISVPAGKPMGGSITFRLGVYLRLKFILNHVPPGKEADEFHPLVWSNPVTVRITKK